MESIEQVLSADERTILTEARKLASSEAQSLVKIIDRLAGALAIERNRIDNRGDRVFRNVAGK
jgi:hypothetical protein